MICAADVSGFYLGVSLVMLGATCAVLWKGRFAYALSLALTVPGLLVISETKAEAVLQGSQCQEMNEAEWPCWIINLFLCTCWWPESPGGGGSGGGGLPGLLYVPPPPEGWGEFPDVE